MLNAMLRQVDAAAVLDDALDRDPANLGLRISRARLAGALGDWQTGEAHCQANLDLSPSHPATLLARLETASAVNLSGPQWKTLAEETRARLETGLESGTGRPEEYRLALGDLAFQERDYDGALDWWRSAGLEDETSNRRSVQIAQCHLFLIDDTSARKCIGAVLEAAPDSVPALQLLAELELSLGNWAKSLEIRSRLLTLGGLHRVSVGVRLAQDHLLRDEQDRAERLLERCAELAVERPEISYARLLMRQQRAAEAWEYAGRWEDWMDQSPMVAQLFEDLEAVFGGRRGRGGSPCGLPAAREEEQAGPPKTADEVRVLFEELEPRASDALGIRQNLRIAWTVREPDGTPYREWLEAVFRSTASNCLFVPKPLVSAQEVAQLTVASDFDVLRPFSDGGHPVLLACSHQGLFTQHLMSLYFPKLRFVTVSNTLDGAGDPDRRNLSLGGDRIGAAARLVQALRQGETIILPLDNSSLSMMSSMPVSAATGRLFGVPTRIPDTIPRLAREFKRPSFWVFSYWQDRHIRYDIQRMPDFEEGEEKTAWHNRWAAAYLARLEAAMKGRAQSINCAAPLWRHLMVNGDKATD
ncbi:hypothetical protein ACFOHM_17345 [Microbaculum marinum]